MNRIALDLEMNQPSDNIIQLGACVFNSKTGEIIEVLSEWVKLPEGEEVTEYISKLCSVPINYKELAIPLEDAYKKLLTLIETYGCTRQPVVWGSGDCRLIKKQLKPDVEWKLGRTEMNVKNIAQSIFEAKELKIQGGLSKSMTRFGMNFLGTKHRADDDAVNTARIYCKILELIKDVT